MNAPNFFILGAARCGTTSLFRSLTLHPDVFMSSPKEPVFFEAEWERGPRYYWEKYFTGWSGQPAVGEARPANLFLPFVPGRVRQLAPAARLIVVLRNPVDRAYSNWRLRRLDGLEPAGFAEAIRDNLASLERGRSFAGEAGERLWRDRANRLRGPDGLRVYVDLGYYAEQLSRYLELFPRRQIKILWFEDLCTNTAEAVRDVWRFLDLDPELGAHESTPHNASVSHVLRPLVRFARFARVGSVLSSRTRAKLRSTAARLVPERAMDGEIRCLLQQHYEPHNRALEVLVDRDLSHWRARRPSDTRP